MDIICVLPLQNQCFDIALKGDKTESVHQSAFFLPVLRLQGFFATILLVGWY